MKLVNKFYHHKLAREDGGPEGRKYIAPDGSKLASVTTILDRTKPEGSKKALENWRRSIGEKKAAEITNEAAFRGTLMHEFLEKSLRGSNPIPGSNIHHRQSSRMAGIILETFLKPSLTEIWGLETNLFYPRLYAGTTDVIGVYNSKPSIVDFKQSNKFKTDDRVEDYKMQLCAYIEAHDIIYNTNIEQGVILMCTKNFEPQSWIISGDELDHYKILWWERVIAFNNLHE